MSGCDALKCSIYQFYDEYGVSDIVLSSRQFTVWRQTAAAMCVSCYMHTHTVHTHTPHACIHAHAHTHTHTHTHIHTHRDVLSNTSHLVVVTHHSLLMLNSQTLELLDWKDLRGEYKL